MRIRFVKNKSRRSDSFRLIRNVSLFMTAFWAVLILRLVQISVLKHSDFVKIAEIQQKVIINVRAPRGKIYDRAGGALAWDIQVPSIFAVPNRIESPTSVAVELANVCNTNALDLKRQLSDESLEFCWVRRLVSPETENKIINLNINGVYSLPERTRGYYGGRDWIYLLGLTDVDGRGIGGAEKGFDNLLRGGEKRISLNRDRRGRELDIDGNYGSIPKSGNSVILTIDAGLQEIVYNKLKEGVNRFKAKGAYAVFLAVGSSEILAMAQYYPQGVSPTRNVNISDTYECGSTFKLVTISTAINSGKFSAYDIIDCENGKYRVGNKTITDYEKAGKISLRRAVEISSNIAAVKLAQALGPDLIYKTAIDFGFGSKTGIRLPGESGGWLKSPDKWSQTDLAVFSYGYGISITALQLVNAYAAVGAGGNLYRPHLLKAVVSPSGEVIENIEPKIIRRVISERTASTLMEFFSGVVDSGTAIKAKVKGLKIAGKTGTARKPIIGGKGYYRNKFRSSFVGFYPADEPRIVGYVVFDEPQTAKMSSYTAVPIFKEILEEYLCSPKGIINDEEDTPKVSVNLCSAIKTENPNRNSIEINKRKAAANKNIKGFESLNAMVIGKPLRIAIRLLRQYGYDFNIEGNGGVVEECYPQRIDGRIKYYIRCKNGE